MSQMDGHISGTLFLVATPIGNLEDITARALRILREVSVIACEDTRHTGILLAHFGIKTQTVSYHEHNEHERAAELLEKLEAGADVAIVSDAGMPAVSDPGYRLVNLCVERSVRIVPVPGATAFALAAIASGLPTDELFYGGFLPAKRTARQSRFASVRQIPATLIFYETPHRIRESLQDAHAVLGERRACVARELTKMHEQFHRGTLSELYREFAANDNVRGEMVLLIDRTTLDTQPETKDANARSISDTVDELTAQGLDPRQALRRAAKELNLNRDEAYRRLMNERAVQRTLSALDSADDDTSHEV